MTEKDLMIQDLQEENRKLKEKIKELEKDKWIPCSERLPKKVIDIRGDKLKFGTCPCCGKRISNVEGGNYCQKCGNRLEWECV